MKYVQLWKVSWMNLHFQIFVCNIKIIISESYLYHFSSSLLSLFQWKWLIDSICINIPLFVLNYSRIAPINLQSFPSFLGWLCIVQFVFIINLSLSVLLIYCFLVQDFLWTVYMMFSSLIFLHRFFNH